MLNQLTFAIKSAIRNFRKNVWYASLNILGLATAFTTIILVSCYLYQERSYESFHEKAERIYRPTHHVQTVNDFEVHFARIPFDYVNHLPEEIPEIEKLIRFQNKEQKYIRIGEKRFKPQHAYQTDGEVFEVFTFPFVHGDPSTSLTKPNSVVLTESTASKYFGRTDVLGEEINMVGDWSPEEETFFVTGVMRDVPVNTHMPMEMLFSFGNEGERTGWAYVYTLLAEGASINMVESKVRAFIDERSDAQSNSIVSFIFQPLSEIHLHSDLAREIASNGNALYLQLFFWVGLFVWLIAVINFANLGAALAMSRGKEVGVRKVLGASRKNIAFFSLTESVVFSLLSMAIGVIGAMLLFQPFSTLTGIKLIPPLVYFLPMLVTLGLISGLIAGIIPSLVLSSVKILQIIKQGNNWSLRQRNNGLNVKRAMISIQFCATVILMGSALVANQQFNFINNKNLGINSHQILTISEVPSEVTQNYSSFKNELLEIPGVSAVTGCMQLPSSEIRDVGPVGVRGSDLTVDQAPMMDMQIIDPDFIQMLDLNLLAGEDFSKDMPLAPYPDLSEDFTVTDYLAQTPRKYFINETAMQQLGWSDPTEAVGQQINWQIGNLSLAYGPIAGVIKNYHQESLKNKVDPLVMTVEPLWWSNFLIKINAQNIPQTIAAVEEAWNQQFPYAFDYSFLDEQFAQLYIHDRVQLKLLSVLTLIAIIVSFMGLVSLVAYALRSRARELAIRRVIGADLRSLTSLVGKEYFLVLCISSIVGIPISYYWVHRWLENFAYHIEISPLIYLLAVSILFLLLVTTILLQTRKATLASPVKALREE